MALDVTGMRFGRLVAIRPTGKMRGRTAWECICDCGNTISVTTGDLRSGNTKSCGCLRDELHRERYTDITGERFGKLTAVRRFFDSGKGKWRWECLCDCGNVSNTSYYRLANGLVKSCGRCKRIGGTNRNTRLDTIYYNIVGRCSKPQNPSYKNYGGRGIKICKEWSGKGGRERFIEWAIASGYEESLTIDRIDNSKGYSPDNCRWVSIKEQNRNKRGNVYVTIDGVTKVLQDWADIYGIKFGTARYRIKHGWSPVEALTSPPYGRRDALGTDG